MLWLITFLEKSFWTGISFNVSHYSYIILPIMVLCIWKQSKLSIQAILKAALVCRHLSQSNLLVQDLIILSRLLLLLHIVMFWRQGAFTNYVDRICHFLTPPYLRGLFLYPECGQKQTFFDPPPPPPPHLVHVVIECPLIKCLDHISSNPYNIWFLFWEKRWLYKIILKFTDL